MYGFVGGISDTAYINYCPKCGKEISIYIAGGFGMCEACGFRFAVIEDEEASDDADDE